MGCLKNAIEVALIESGIDLKLFADGPTIKAVGRKRIEGEFRASYVGDSPDAKRVAFGRAVEKALSLKLIGYRQIGDDEYFWLIKDGKPQGFAGHTHAEAAQ